MPPITKPTERVIIEDFAKEIRERRLGTAKPEMAVINFRDDRLAGREREQWKVPIALLRYRKDNGRISSDVMDYERNIGILDEKDDRAQDLIAKFLEDKDPVKTDTLKKTILHSGQIEPAIITCDGFVINGNRRKLVMTRLHAEHPENDEFGVMKVVILPGPDEEGGPPTLIELETLENRYQLQNDGKAEYYGFDRALSIKRKIDLGLDLKTQLRDDPQYARATPADMEKAVEKCEKEYLAPLECIDRYLRQCDRKGQYKLISSGMGDPNGRWQAFVDYSNTYNRSFRNPKRRLELGIQEDEIGGIEEAAFDMIRLREIPDMPKIHYVMRDLPKYCSTTEGKKEILKIAEEVEPVLPAKECRDEHGSALTLEQVEERWRAKAKQAIIYRVKKARQSHEARKEKETPLDLLDAAYRKLMHDNMDLKSLGVADLKKARQMAQDIRDRVDEITSELYHVEKDMKKLKDKLS